MGEIITVNKRIKYVEENCNNRDLIRKYKPSYKILPILPILSFNKTTLHKDQNILIMLLLDHQRSQYNPISQE